jgi:hypothetical protein
MTKEKRDQRQNRLILHHKLLPAPSHASDEGSGHHCQLLVFSVISKGKVHFNRHLPSSGSQQRLRTRLDPTKKHSIQDSSLNMSTGTVPRSYSSFPFQHIRGCPVLLQTRPQQASKALIVAFN